MQTFFNIIFTCLQQLANYLQKCKIVIKSIKCKIINFRQKKSTNDAKFSKNAENLPNTYICKKLTSSCYTMYVGKMFGIMFDD